tara:strand:- start:97 stop:528 length:432 start_codon:yes stop_codon:yes gene_type:complete
MRRHLQTLHSERHLKHHSRWQFTLFLKGMDLTVDEALAVWRSQFAHGKMADFQREHTYAVRHSFGLEGEFLFGYFWLFLVISTWAIRLTACFVNRKDGGLPAAHVREAGEERDARGRRTGVPVRRVRAGRRRRRARRVGITRE